MKVCGQCKHKFSDDFTFCPKCGNKLEEQFKCPKCQKLVNTDFVYCPYCGTAMFVTEVNESTLTEINQNKETTEANNFFEYNAESNQEKRGLDLFELYFPGMSKEENEKEIVRAYLKEAEQGNVNAQFELGRRYHVGEGVEENLEEAFKWYMKAAGQGNTDAQLAIGDIYFCGADTANIEVDIEEALRWYLKAAEQGNVEAQYRLGEIYCYGDCVEIDKCKAFEWYLKAAKAGNRTARDELKSEFGISDCLSEEEIKRVWGGILNTQGIEYCDGIKVEKDYKKAAECFSKAAELGNPYAQFNLAISYMRGEGVAQSYSLAQFYFSAAARQGMIDAQYNLGLLYETGDGGEKNFEKAIEWYHKAGEQGYQKANESLARVEKILGNLNKSTNYPHMRLSHLARELIGLAANNAFNDNLWQACGFKKAPVRGSLFNIFVNHERLDKETFLRREFMIAPIGIFVGKLRKRMYFSDVEYIKYLTDSILDVEGVADALKFNNISEAKKYFESYIKEYNQTEGFLTDIFLKHCRCNNIEIDDFDSELVKGAQQVCDSLSAFLEQKILETEEKYYIEDDITSFRFNKSNNVFTISKPMLAHQPGIKDTLGKKYELTDERIVLNGRTLYRIRALKDFDLGFSYADGNRAIIKKGELGGFIAGENNLSQVDKCWVFHNAKVYDNAILQNNAYIQKNVEVYGNAMISDNSKIVGDVQVFGNTQVLGNSYIGGEAKIYGESIIRNSNISVWGGYTIKDKVIENKKIRT